MEDSADPTGLVGNQAGFNLDLKEDVAEGFNDQEDQGMP